MVLPASTCHTIGLPRFSPHLRRAASAGPCWCRWAPIRWAHPNTRCTDSSRSEPETPCWSDLDGGRREGEEGGGRREGGGRLVALFFRKMVSEVLKLCGIFELKPLVSTSLARAHSVLPSDVRTPTGGSLSSAFSAIFFIFSSWDKISISLSCLPFTTTSNTKN